MTVRVTGAALALPWRCLGQLDLHGDWAREGAAWHAVVVNDGKVVHWEGVA